MSLEDDFWDISDSPQQQDQERRSAITEAALMSKNIIQAVVQNNVDNVRDLLNSPESYEIKNELGNPLLHIAILENSVDVFDFLLSIENYPVDAINRVEKTALMTCLFSSKISDHFAKELIQKGANIHLSDPDDYTALHYALLKGSFEVVQMLIEHGADVNAKTKFSYSPLHMMLMDKVEHMNEGVPLLLYHGADPLIEDYRGNTPFEMAVIRNSKTVEEVLLYYTFDKFTEYEIPIKILFEMIKNQSPLLQQIMPYITDVDVDYPHIMHDYRNMLFSKQIDGKFLKLLIAKFDYLIRELLSTSTSSVFASVNVSIENTNILFESHLVSEMIEFTQKYVTYNSIIMGPRPPLTPNAITELLHLFLSYGMNIYEKDIDIVYQKYGYCELFKTLIHMDIKKKTNYKRQIMPALIYDVTLNFANLERDLWSHSYNKNFDNVLSLFAHPDSRAIECAYYRNSADVLKKLPQIPLLVELARNIIRKFIIEKFSVQNFGQLNAIVKRLPISTLHEKIIMYEAPLY